MILRCTFFRFAIKINPAWSNPVIAMPLIASPTNPFFRIILMRSTSGLDDFYLNAAHYLFNFPFPERSIDFVFKKITTKISSLWF